MNVKKQIKRLKDELTMLQNRLSYATSGSEERFEQLQSQQKRIEALERELAGMNKRAESTFGLADDHFKTVSDRISAIEGKLVIHDGCIDVLNDPAAFDALAKRVSMLEKQHSDLIGMGGALDMALAKRDNRIASVTRWGDSVVEHANAKFNATNDRIAALEVKLASQPPTAVWTPIREWVSGEPVQTAPQPAPIAEGKAAVVYVNATYGMVNLGMQPEQAKTLHDLLTKNPQLNVRVTIHADGSEAQS